ncbi:MAG TPA: DinB family protein [Gemmatimonadaceae bacterium]|nr:DinB family protein [Gemmatimonadaceae bacterium]
MSETEWWQRGPVIDVPALMQPVAHMVLQVGESVHELVDGLTEAEWNAKPGNVASAAFHVRHITGVLDRLFTYARGESLSAEQFAHLRGEDARLAIEHVPMLLAAMDAQVVASLAQLRRTDPSTLAEFRPVGRAKLPSTVIGCLVHGGEHCMRHVGQLSVTVRLVRGLALA